MLYFLIILLVVVLYNQNSKASNPRRPRKTKEEWDQFSKDWKKQYKLDDFVREIRKPGSTEGYH